MSRSATGQPARFVAASRSGRVCPSWKRHGVRAARTGPANAASIRARPTCWRSRGTARLAAPARVSWAWRSQSSAVPSTARCFGRCTGRSPDSLTGSTVRDPDQVHLGPRGKQRTTAGTPKVGRSATPVAATCPAAEICPAATEGTKARESQPGGDRAPSPRAGRGADALTRRRGLGAARPLSDSRWPERSPWNLEERGLRLCGGVDPREGG